jgi:hypothetical protein
MDIKAEKYLKDKFKNVSAMSFTTFNNELVVSFDGFENQEDIIDFADYLFSKIKMRYLHSDKVPTYH